MAERIQRGDNVGANLEHLARFSEEMKAYLCKRIKNAEDGTGKGDCFDLCVDSVFVIGG